MAKTFEQMSDDRLDRDIRIHCEPRPEQEMIQCFVCGDYVPKDESCEDFATQPGERSCNQCTKELIEKDIEQFDTANDLER